MREGASNCGKWGLGGTELSNPQTPAPFITLVRVKNNCLISLN